MALFEEKALCKSYKTMLTCLFQMYEAKLEQTIGLVNKGKIAERNILPSLTKFKSVLVKDCTYLIDDIWNNYKFYLNQKKRDEDNV